LWCKTIDTPASKVYNIGYRLKHQAETRKDHARCLSFFIDTTMIILSNGFFTNMPNSEAVSQGGPANFAKLFSRHIVDTTDHRWIGIIFRASESKASRLRRILSFGRKDYFKLYFPKRTFKKITKAKKVEDSSIILSGVIGRVVSFIKKEKPDIVFLNGFGLFNWVLLKAAEKTNTPVVIQHAGIWTKELRLHKYLYSRAGLKMMEKMEKDSTRLSSAEVFLNTWSRDYYRRNVAQNSGNESVVIPLPFDFETFGKLSKTHKKSLITMPGAFKIGTIARWDNIKNHKAILALARAAGRLHLPWQFYAVTKIPEKHCLKNSYKKNIETIPALDRTGISDFCNSMDLLVLPSIFDVSPTVALEAVATGTPIAISNNVGYVNDFKRYGARKWVIDFRNTAKVLTSIKKIAQKPLPNSLREQIVAKHDHEKVFSAYLDLFYETVAKTKIKKR